MSEPAVGQKCAIFKTEWPHSCFSHGACLQKFINHLYKTEQCSALCSDIAGMLLKSTGEFLDAGLKKSDNEFWESADDSTASDEIRWGWFQDFIKFLLMFLSHCILILNSEAFNFCRRSVVETSRSLKELFHEARERASKALGFAKMLRKVRNWHRKDYSLPWLKKKKRRCNSTGFAVCLSPCFLCLPKHRDCVLTRSLCAPFSAGLGGCCRFHYH